MIDARLAVGAYGIMIRHTINPVSWQYHYENFINPELATRLLRKSVPVLEEIQWEVKEVSEGHAVTYLPLSEASTNQHGTHQAALISLSADYTGGIALASLLRGVPFAGINPCNGDESASLWLADMSVRYRHPSTGHLTGSCTVPKQLVSKIVNRYFTGKKVLVRLPMEFYSNDELIAEAELSYFVQPSRQLKPTKQNPAISPIYETKLKASARMIAGVRAQRSNNKLLRFDNPHAEVAAGAHGKLLAQKLSEALPQLTDMVHARTKHGDQAFLEINDLQQVVLIGAGLDMRPYRLHGKHESLRWFELDLPVMLEERQKAAEQLGRNGHVNRHAVPADFNVDDLSQLLLDHPNFDPKLPTLIIYEGCSMYFEQEANERTLRQLSKLMQHPDSRLWCDIVSGSAIEKSADNSQVQAFLDGMEELGEKFIFGHDAPEDFLRQCGFATSKVTSVAEFIHSDDPVHELYKFVVARS